MQKLTNSTTSLKCWLIKDLNAEKNIVPALLFFLMTLFIAPSISYSDGISVTPDLKHVNEEHTTIKLTKAQILDVERKREVTLTVEQLRPLRKIYKKVPRKLVIVSSRWDSCTCDMDIYAIWCRPGEIDVPHSELEGMKMSDEYYEKNPVKASPNKDHDNDETAVIKSDYAGENVILDSKGRMFIKGRLTTEKEMYGAIDRLSRSKAQHKSIYLDIPPPIGDKIDNAIRALSDRLEAYSKKKGIGFWALGLSAEKQMKEER